MKAAPKPVKPQPKMADIIRAYYAHSQALYDKAEADLLAQLKQFSHKDHLIFNFIRTGTFTDKLASIKELIEVP